MDARAITSVLTFSVSSAGLLLVNKLCLKQVPLPSYLAVMQFVASVLCALGLSAAGLAELDRLEWPRVRAYLVYIALFTSAIYTNMHALTHSNVETLIVFRACGRPACQMPCLGDGRATPRMPTFRASSPSGPLLVSVLEWQLLGRMLPTRRSGLALLGICVCAAGYVASDRAFGAHAHPTLPPGPTQARTAAAH